MAENSAIEWTDATFNPWIGCTRVSPGCENCYAETRNKRFQKPWGPTAPREVKAEHGWREPIRWDKAAAALGSRPRVFCASLADVYDDWPGQVIDHNKTPMWATRERFVWVAGHKRPWPECVPLTLNHVRDRLFDVIARTPNLDWLLLTKRPENVLKMTHDEWCKKVPGHVSQNDGDGRRWEFPANVWLGVTAEDQKRADERIPILKSIPARVRFLSVEPMLGPVDLSNFIDCYWSGTRWAKSSSHHVHRVGWVIVGGESGPGARPFDVTAARSVVSQCRAAGVPVFVKQMGDNPVEVVQPSVAPGSLKLDTYDMPGGEPDDTVIPLQMAPKGNDMSEWTADLRIREFPS